MRSTLLASAGLAAAALVFAGGSAEARTVLTQVVQGRMLPSDDGDATGKFRILVKTVGTSHREYFYVDGWGLDTTKDEGGNLPDYRAWLVSADGNTAADFGEVYLGPRGRAKLRFHSARDSFPSGVETLKDFAGGTAEIRLGDALVLSGDVPDFLGLTDENGKGSHASAKAVGVLRLRATEDGGRAKGLIWALYVNRPLLTAQALRVECLGLGKKGDTFTAVAIDDQGTETTLGTMTSRTSFAVAVLNLSTRRGDTMPGDGVLSLGGQAVEVRDAGGTVWLKGKFPVLAE